MIPRPSSDSLEEQGQNRFRNGQRCLTSVRASTVQRVAKAACLDNAQPLRLQDSATPVAGGRSVGAIK